MSLPRVVSCAIEPHFPDGWDLQLEVARVQPDGVFGAVILLSCTGGCVLLAWLTGETTFGLIAAGFVVLGLRLAGTGPTVEGTVRAVLSIRPDAIRLDGHAYPTADLVGVRVDGPSERSILSLRRRDGTLQELVQVDLGRPDAQALLEALRLVCADRGDPRDVPSSLRALADREG